MPPQAAATPRHITDGPEPKHAQLRAVLTELCAGAGAPDGAIPSERKLMAEYAPLTRRSQPPKP